MEILWKKEASTDLFVDIFKNVPNDAHRDVFEQLGQMFKPNVKDNKFSTMYRKEGNKKFLEKKVLEAMHLYNQSLRYAEIETENMSIAYGNRSACFFELKLFAKCMTDIQLAKKAKYPERLLPKLLNRHEQCLKLMMTMDPQKTFVPKLDFCADKNFPEMANVLQIQCNEKYGRHITAKCNIGVGKIVLIDEAFVQAMSKMETNCVLCSKKAMNFIPCNYCVNAMMCHNDCTINYHGKECGIGDRYFMDGMQLVVRSIFMAWPIFKSVSELMEFVEDVVAADAKEIPKTLSDEKSKYRAFLKLNVVKSSNDRRFFKTAKEMYTTMSSRTSIISVFNTERKQRFLMHLISHHYGAIQTNLYKFQHSAADKKSHFLLLVMQSYLNHSCVPNVIFSIYGNKSICTTARPIKKGEQLFVTYSDIQATEEDKNIRQKYFHESYGFRCECDKCVPVGSRLKMSRLINMESSFENIVTELQLDPKTLERHAGKRENIKKMCIQLLNKFGNCWTDEVQHISYILRAIYSIEETNLNLTISD